MMNVAPQICRKEKYLIDDAKTVILLLEGRKPTCEIIEESVLSAKDVRRLYDGGFWKRFSHFLLSNSLDSQTQQSSAVSEQNFHRQNTLPPSEHPSTVRTHFHRQNTFPPSEHPSTVRTPFPHQNTLPPSEHPSTVRTPFHRQNTFPPS